MLTAKDGSNNIITYQYDTSGNLILQRDAANNTVTRTYGANNELLTETRYGVPDPDGAGTGQPDEPVTTRYAYDSENHLRFAVSAEGHVTEYVYDSYGRQTASIAYRDNAYDLSALLPTDILSETTLTSWVSGIADLSTVGRVNTAWDFRGNAATVTSYSAATTAGVGTGAYTRVTYTYDQFGNLLTRATTGITNTEVFTYDGLGRLRSSNDLNNAATSIVYTDSQNTMVATLANGFVQTSIYNYAGALVSYAESGTGFTTGTATYTYDSLGNLRIATDASARKSYYFYDALGRKAGDIAADGTVVEYGYDTSDRLVKTIRYATRLDAVGLACLVDPSGNPAFRAFSR